MLDPETAKALIQPSMPVVDANHDQFAVVDRLEGLDLIKLAKDPAGQHHYIPLIWVTSVDDKIHIDRSAAQARHAWSTTPRPPTPNS